MSNDTSSSGDGEAISDMEAWHHAYAHAFRWAVGCATLPAEQQCEEMGDYNVAWELRDDLSSGKYLFNRGRLSGSQEGGIAALVALVELVPANELPAGAGRAPNLASMQHHSWAPEREKAEKVLQQLEQVTRANAAYFRPTTKCGPNRRLSASANSSGPSFPLLRSPAPPSMSPQRSAVPPLSRSLQALGD